MIGVLQTTTGIDPVDNAAALVRGVEQAAAAGAAMLFTPEMSGLLDRDRARAARHVVAENNNPVLHAVRAAARRAGIWVHLGSLAIRRDDGRWVNRGFVIDGAGAIRAHYDKLHLFDVDLPGGERWCESASYAAGDTALVVDTPVGRLGLSICYDLRFPALFAALAAAGATVLAVPAAFTQVTGAAHWHVLLRARAIENGCFLVAAAQTGAHQDGRATYGRSLVVDPWGAVLVDAGDAPGLALATLDPAQPGEVRARLPVAAHRRPIPPVGVA